MGGGGEPKAVTSNAMHKHAKIKPFYRTKHSKKCHMSLKLPCHYNYCLCYKCQFIKPDYLQPIAKMILFPFKTTAIVAMLKCLRPIYLKCYVICKANHNYYLVSIVHK